MIDHRASDGFVCDRCGAPMRQWPEVRCMPSTVTVLEREEQTEPPERGRIVLQASGYDPPRVRA